MTNLGGGRWRCSTCGYQSLSTIVRNRLSLNQAESFFLFSSGGVMVTMSSTVQELYAANMDNDGFLYIEYASQETFGASMHSTEGQL